MASDENDEIDAALATEESQLRAELGHLLDSLLGGLRKDHHHAAENAAAEKQVRAIVLRLTHIERERIENTIARSL